MRHQNQTATHGYHDIITPMCIAFRLSGSRWTAGLLTVALTGCVTLPIPVGAGAPQALPKELVTYYEYPRQTLQPTIESAKEKSGYRIQYIHLEIPGNLSSRPIRVDWYQPHRPGRLPVVLMSPILAGNDLYIREFARFYAARGLHAVIVYRPKEVFSADRDLKDVETHFHDSVINLRQILDWLEAQDSVDPKRIGSFAISLGAILTTILAAVEPRIRCSVMGLPAGHIPEIIMASRDKAIRKRRKVYLERHGWSNEEALRQLQAVMVSEPMRVAPAIDPTRTLVIVGLFDRVLGLHRSLDLWQAMGRPKLIVLPTGHYSAYVATPYLKLVTYSFLRRHLGTRAGYT